MIRYSSLSILLVSLAVKAIAAEPDRSAFATIKDGIHYVDGKPFLKTAAWWGANHWMTGYARAEFQGFGANGMSRDWRDWKGVCHGYEGLLVGHYHALLAVLDDMKAKL